MENEFEIGTIFYCSSYKQDLAELIEIVVEDHFRYKMRNIFNEYIFYTTSLNYKILPNQEVVKVLYGS